MALFWLSDEARVVIEPHLTKNQADARRVDNRRVISGSVHMLKVGCCWCDCPADYGTSTTIYNWLNRWSRRGFWLKLFPSFRGAATGNETFDTTRADAAINT